METKLAQGEAQAEMRRWRMKSVKFFLFLVALCIMNMHQKSKQLTKTTAWGSCVSFVQQQDPWRAKNFQLNHDNAPPDFAHVIQDFLTNTGNSMLLV